MWNALTLWQNELRFDAALMHFDELFSQVWLTTISAATRTTPTTSTKLQQYGALRPIPALSGKPAHLWVWLLQLLSAFGCGRLSDSDSSCRLTALQKNIKKNWSSSFFNPPNTPRSAPMDMPSPTTMSELCWKSAPMFFGFWPLSIVYWCAVSSTGHLRKLCLVMSHDSSQAVGWWDWVQYILCRIRLAIAVNQVAAIFVKDTPRQAWLH